MDAPRFCIGMLLRLALLNSYGVWCYENHEFDVSVSCFEEMMYMFDEACTFLDDDKCNFDATVKRGFQSNLHAFLVA
jgi:hypothetical protein